MKDYNSFKELQTDLTHGNLGTPEPTYNDKQVFTYSIKGITIELTYYTQRSFNVNAHYVLFNNEPIYTVVYNNSKLSSNVKKKLALKESVRYVEDMNKETALKLARRIMKMDGGATLDSSGTDYVGSGYVVATVNNELILDKNFNQLTTAIKQQLFIQQDEFLDVWCFGGNIYLDLVNVYQSKEEAIRIGRENNQLAIFDLKESKEIFL